MTLPPLVKGTDWDRVTVWGDRAERTAEQFRKGNKVFVEGRFRTREYDAKDGTKRISLDITADNVISLDARVRNDDEAGSSAGSSGGFSGGASSGGASSGGQASGSGVRPTRPQAASKPDDDLDDLPF